MRELKNGIKIIGTDLRIWKLQGSEYRSSERYHKL